VYVVLIAALIWIMKNGMRWRQSAAEAKRLKADGHKEAIAEDRA
jgi:hypothetical protein